MKLTVVIPHRRNPERLLRTLRAVEPWPALVVDDSDEGLDLDVPKVRLGGGQGFARAANRGLAEVRTPWALVLNDDALPLEDCIERLSAQGGLCGPLLVGSLGVESAGLRVTAWGRVLQRREPGPIQALSGACLHLPASARFDERFRHGSEDVELCRRMKGEGMPPRLVPEALCWHEGGGTLSRRHPTARRYAVEGHLRLWERGWRDSIILGLATAQCLREGGGWEGLRGIAEGWKSVRHNPRGSANFPSTAEAAATAGLTR